MERFDSTCATSRTALLVRLLLLLALTVAFATPVPHARAEEGRFRVKGEYSVSGTVTIGKALWRAKDGDPDGSGPDLALKVWVDDKRVFSSWDTPVKIFSDSPSATFTFSFSWKPSSTVKVVVYDSDFTGASTLLTYRYRVTTSMPLDGAVNTDKLLGEVGRGTSMHWTVKTSPVPPPTNEESSRETPAPPHVRETRTLPHVPGVVEFECRAQWQRAVVSREDGQYWYSSWDGKNSGTPDVQVPGGEWSSEGSGPCRYDVWAFESDQKMIMLHTRGCSADPEGYANPADYPPDDAVGSLEIREGQAVLSQWCMAVDAAAQDGDNNCEMREDESGNLDYPCRPFPECCGE